MAVQYQHIMCNVTNQQIRKLLPEDRYPQATVACNRTASHCDFQFWIGEQESFYCDFTDCTFSQDVSFAKNITTYQCTGIKCRCIPGRMLCGESGSIDISDFLTQEVKGPGKFKCTEDEGRADRRERSCSFEEPALNDLITSFFGDPYIEVDCMSGECMHYSQVPGFVRPSPGIRFGTTFMILAATAAIVLVGAILGTVMFVARRQDMSRGRERSKYDQLIQALLGESEGELSIAEQDELRRSLLMAGHKPMTLAWKNISYSVDLASAPSRGAAFWSRAADPRRWFGGQGRGGQANVGDIAPFGDDSDDQPLVTERVENGLQERSPSDGSLTILEGVHGVVRPGQVCAIMGGSGAGKTTFLDILARRNKAGLVGGEITINGRPVTADDYKRSIGYVDQEDTLMGTLTVRETITYSALLRLPREMSHEAKRFRVQETMIELGIQGIADRRIGQEGMRGISGGEKRRVSIACELVTSPSILFLDEPTSGLDSFNAYNVVECLVSLARNYQRTILMTIHQPRSNIYALFDVVVLLAKGKMIYSGPAQEDVIRHFESLGFYCPMGFNIADYLVDLTMHVIAADMGEQGSASQNRDIELNSSTVGDGSRRDLRPISRVPSAQSPREELEDRLYSPRPRPGSSLRTSPLPPGGDGSANMAARRQQLAKNWSEIQDHLQHLAASFTQSETHKTLIREITELTDNAEPVPSRRPRLYGDGNFNGRRADDAEMTLEGELDWNARPTWGTQFLILSGRTFKNMYRNPGLLQAHYIISLLVAAMCGVLFWQVSNDLAGFQNRLGFFFFVCALFGFSCLSSLQVFATERAIFVRERANRYYSPITYFLSKLIFDVVPLRVVPPLILGLIVYPMIGLRAETSAFMLKFLLVLVLFNLTAASVCLAIGIVFKDLGVANLVSSLVVLFAMLFGGLLLNKASVPSYFNFLQAMSFFNYALEALIVNEVNGLTLRENKFGLQIDVPGATVLQTFGFNALGFWSDIVKLLLYFLGLTLFAFGWLHFFVKERR